MFSGFLLEGTQLYSPFVTWPFEVRLGSGFGASSPDIIFQTNLTLMAGIHTHISSL